MRFISSSSRSLRIMCHSCRSAPLLHHIAVPYSLWRPQSPHDSLDQLNELFLMPCLSQLPHFSFQMPSAKQSRMRAEQRLWACYLSLICVFSSVWLQGQQHVKTGCHTKEGASNFTTREVPPTAARCLRSNSGPSWLTHFRKLILRH